MITREREATPPASEPTYFLAPKLEESLTRLDNLAERYLMELGQTRGKLRRAAVLGVAIQQLRASITPEVLEVLRGLMNSQLGFKTDRPTKNRPTPYGDDTIRDCAVEAILNGVNWTGNQFNIIADRCYVTKEGYQFKFGDNETGHQAQGITDVEVIPGTPFRKDGKTFIRVAARCKFRGTPIEIRDHEGKPGRVFSINAYEGTTDDNVVGKGTRKGYRALWEQVFGSEHTPPDGEVGENGGDGGQAPALEAGKHRIGRGGKHPLGTMSDPDHGPSEEQYQQQAPPAEDQQEAERQAVDWVKTWSEDLKKASTEEQFRELGDRIGQNLEWLGTPRAAALRRELQVKWDGAKQGG